MSDFVPRSLAGGSIAVLGAPSIFDVDSENALLDILKIIHQNPINPETKNHLRDLVFEYRQNKQEESFTQLAKALAQIGINIARNGASQIATAPVSQKNNSSLGMLRVVPRFGLAQTQKTQPESVVPVPRKVVVTSAAPTPLTSVEVGAIKTPPVIVATEELPVMVDLPALQRRISEIKHAVNEKVGNPVNLMDTYPDLGKEYMSALLDAMKKVNGSNHADLVAAMSRLEQNANKILTTTSAASPVTTPIAKQPVLSSVAKEVPVKQNVVVAPVAQAARASLAEVKQQLGKKVIQTNPAVPHVQPQSITNQPLSQTQTTEQQMRSVAKDKLLQDLLRSNREKEIQLKETQEQAAIAAMDPIMVPEVTAGLSQLLSEWSLFKSSGFFGTGPSGKEHPLYVTLAPLTLAVVISGRFEGATPLIKQNISDYMNGWRYEEGIVHEHTETFEHYLRRVVLHIITKKKQQQRK